MRARPLAKAQPDYPRFAPGDRVVVTAGLAVGLEAVVLATWPKAYGGVPQYVIGSDDLVRKRVLRADHLRLDEGQS